MQLRIGFIYICILYLYIYFTLCVYVYMYVYRLVYAAMILLIDALAVLLKVVISYIVNELPILHISTCYHHIYQCILLSNFYS